MAIEHWVAGSNAAGISQLEEASDACPDRRRSGAQ